jgi:hypothetical protein
MRLLALVFAVLALGAGAAIAAPRLGGAQPPKFPALPGNWSHADINVTIRRVAHTITLDRGRIIQVSTTQLTLLERDGTTADIPITPQTIVTILGRPGSILDLRKREKVETMRIDGGPAVRLRVTSRA